MGILVIYPELFLKLFRIKDHTKIFKGVPSSYSSNLLAYTIPAEKNYVTEFREWSCHLLESFSETHQVATPWVIQTPKFSSRIFIVN